MKKLLILILIPSLAGAGYGYFALRDASNATAGVQYRTAKVERGEVIEGVAATGTVQPVVLVQVGTQISGAIEKLFADFNSQVKAGQTIALLDSRRLAATVAADEAAATRAKADVVRMRAADVQARSEVGRARAQAAAARADVARVQALLTQAEHDFERQKPLADSEVISPADLDSVVASKASLAAQLGSAQANVEQMEAAIASAEATVQQDEAQIAVGEAAVKQSEAELAGDRVNLDYATIESPVDGTVVSRNVDVGQTVAASLQAPTLFLIAQDLTKVQVQVSVPEADIGKIHKDQPAHFTVDAYTDKSFEGVVSQVRLASTAVQNVVTYTVVVDASNPDGLLFPGMTATLTFEVARSAKDALHVPVTALRVQPAPELLVASAPAAGAGHGDKTKRAAAKTARRGTFVYVVEPGERLRPIEVRPGISDLFSTTVELVDPNALQEGAEVVTAILREQEAATTNPFAPPRVAGGRNPR